jgi:hypothetical protein
MEPRQPCAYRMHIWITTDVAATTKIHKEIRELMTSASSKISDAKLLYGRLGTSKGNVATIVITFDHGSWK